MEEAPERHLTIPGELPPYLGQSMLHSSFPQAGYRWSRFGTQFPHVSNGECQRKLFDLSAQEELMLYTALFWD